MTPQEFMEQQKAKEKSELEGLDKVNAEAQELGIPTTDEVVVLMRKLSSGLQFKNSLKYIQGGTNVNLERMIDRFDIVLGDAYLEGFRAALEWSSKAIKEKL